MNPFVVALLFILNISLLLLVALVLCLLQMRRLRQALTARRSKTRVRAEASAAVWREQLEEEMATTKQELRRLQAAPEATVDMSEKVLQLRLVYLRAELNRAAAGSDAAAWERLHRDLGGFLTAALRREDVEQACAEVALLRGQLATERTRVSNLETFRNRFLSMQERWKAAKLESLDYYRKLNALTEAGEISGEGAALIQDLGQVNQSVDAMMSALPAPKADTAAISYEELEQLQRALDAKEAEVLHQEQRLTELSSLRADLERVTDSLRRQIEEANQRSAVLQALLSEAQEKVAENASLQAMVTRFTTETRDLMVCLQTLENENGELRSALQQAQRMSPASVGERLSAAQEVARLAELEQRFLAVDGVNNWLIDEVDALARSLRATEPRLAARLAALCDQALAEGAAPDGPDHSEAAGASGAGSSLLNDLRARVQDPELVADLEREITNLRQRVQATHLALETERAAAARAATEHEATQQEVEQLVAQFTAESKDMMAVIHRLEAENAELQHDRSA
jgi:DNA repair exonuclease SbcCD ATPase subunit